MESQMESKIDSQATDLMLNPQSQSQSQPQPQPQPQSNQLSSEIEQLVEQLVEQKVKIEVAKAIDRFRAEMGLASAPSPMFEIPGKVTFKTFQAINGVFVSCLNSAIKATFILRNGGKWSKGYQYDCPCPTKGGNALFVSFIFAAENVANKEGTHLHFLRHRTLACSLKLTPASGICRCGVKFALQEENRTIELD
jgi:hypothetical protein